MAEDEEPQFKSLKDRIAALNLGAGGAAPVPAPAPLAPKARPSPLVPASKPAPPAPRPHHHEELHNGDDAAELPQYIAKRGLPPPKTNGSVAPPPTHTARDEKQLDRLKRPTAPKVFPKRPEKPAPTYSYHKEMAPPVRRTSSSTSAEHDTPTSPPRAPPLLPHRGSDATPSLPPRRPSIEPEAHRPGLPPRKPSDNTPKLPPRRPSVDPHHAAPGLPARRPSIEPVARAVPPLPSKPPLPTTSKPPLPTSSKPALPSAPKPALPSSAKPGLPSSAKPTLPSSPKPASPAPPRKLQWPPQELTPDEVPSTPPVNDRGAPPPVPLASRPTSKPKPAAQFYAGHHPDPPDCLVCRDFSQPDHYAASYPRASLPAHDAVGYLAEALCDPFPSATDKARAIFTWFHYNVAYDVAMFCSGNLRGMSPEETIRTGMAVCQGYADTFAAIAQRAGLECVVVSGHGKGAGIKDWVQGEPIPRMDSNHAWNAVRIEGGWKLVDACWGAGNIDLAAQTYDAHFNPIHFSMLNDDFGRTHFPKDPGQFYVPNPPSWEEYVVGSNGGFARPIVTSTAHEEGINQWSIEPSISPIPLVASDPPSVRFQMTTVCPHWNAATNGKGPEYLFMLYMPWRKGKEVLMPMEHGGGWWWLDVSIDELARGRGQKVTVVVLTSLSGRDGRGITSEEYAQSLRSHGAWSFSNMFIASWDL
ncbi:Kyphoscoliosis peptidase [Vanrija pseudolonga]|uniref:Kyphoscoliosis peptidase n=1 Tax=Vanrija pseudolonga TaxID=143232 RepID=A0AAF0Y623_9TREE|nr:Kyphoscoliosis peptidase [Vanrija pseudolonga]